MDENIFTGLLDCNVPIRIRPVGLSMHPFIRRGDSITITPLSPANPDRSGDVIEPGDCVIFRDGPERWLIHRVIENNHNNRTIIAKGDALIYPDQPVTPEMIWGTVTVIHRANSKKNLLLYRPLYRRICRLIALLSRGEALISSTLRIHRREVELSPSFEFVIRVIKFPKWTLTRVFFS